MANPQRFGARVNEDVPTNSLGINAHQSMSQEQLLNVQQRMQLQQRQRQQASLIAQRRKSDSQVQSPQPPAAEDQLQCQSQQKQQQQDQPFEQQRQQQFQDYKNYNAVSLCKYGQELVHEIYDNSQQVFKFLAVLQTPNGTVQRANAVNTQKIQLREKLQILEIFFKRLKLIYDTCNENCQLQGMEYTHIESLIPLHEEWDMKSDEKKISESYRLLCQARNEILEQVTIKNRQLKDVLDHMRHTIFKISTMLETYESENK